MSGSSPNAPAGPAEVLRQFAALRRAALLYPRDHPQVDSSASELATAVRRAAGERARVELDLARAEAHLDGRRIREPGAGAIAREVTEAGVGSLWFDRDVRADELKALAGWLADGMPRKEDETAAAALERLGVRRVRPSRLVPVDGSWTVREWPDRPSGDLDPHYLESLLRAEEAFGGFAEDRAPRIGAIRDLLQLLVFKVARSSTALGQVLAIKRYENHTYCHSVNVAILGLLLGRRLGLDETQLARLCEAALLHDVGKTRMPLEILRKPGPLDAREWRIIRRHPRLGATILLELPGLAAPTPSVALEHHRGWRGGGYPELPDDPNPHPLSQIVAVADTYESLTGARSYRDPAPPERACLVLARMAGDKLNPDLVRAFVGTVTFFPLGSVVRTSAGETAVVVATHADDPLHPSVTLASGEGEPGRTLDLRERDSEGVYLRHVERSVPAEEAGVEPARFLAPDP